MTTNKTAILLYKMPPIKPTTEDIAKIDARLSKVEDNYSEIKSNQAETNTTLKFIAIQLSENTVRVKDAIDAVENNTKSRSETTDKFVTSTLDKLENRVSSQIGEVKSSVNSLEQTVLGHNQIIIGMQDKAEKAAKFRLRLWALAGTLVGAIGTGLAKLIWAYSHIQ